MLRGCFPLASAILTKCQGLTFDIISWYRFIVQTEILFLLI